MTVSPSNKTLPDLTDCDREPIHIPGSIQPHGVMLVADSEELFVRHTAGDLQRVLGIPSQLNVPLADYIGRELTDKAVAMTADLKRGFVGSIERPEGSLDVTVFRSDNFMIAEIESRQERTQSPAEILGALERASAALDQSTSLKSLCEVAAKEFGKLTCYDRVMVYRFLDDGAGMVLAEDRREDLHSFLNHHFPGSDIPQQARALYVRNLVRVIPDVNYTPSPLQPPLTSGKPLDMSDSILRSVSPIHLQYLKNMGIAASASISIVKDGALWGLIACHHESPLTIPYQVRAACRALSGGFVRQIKLIEETEAYRERLRLRGSEDKTIELLTRNDSLEDAAAHHLEELSRLFGGDGFAVLHGDKVLTVGICPPDDDVRQLAGWLIGKYVEGIYTTDRLPKAYPSSEKFQDVASGVLTLQLSAEERWFLIWFRAEEIQIVKWAGNPHKAVELKAGEVLSPRASFEAWQETVRGRSRRWTLAEIEGAVRIRQKLIEVRHSRRLRNLNRQLTEALSAKDALLDQNQFLIGEVNHRVQNSLQLVSSFLSFQARDAADPAFTAAVEEARRRIGAVSLLHRSLYRSDTIGVTDAGRYVEELCGNLIASLGNEWTQHFSLRLGPLMLPIDRMIPLGLVVTELIININKYAYDGAPGPIEVSLTEERSRFRLVVADRGKGRASVRPGFGTRMMTGLVGQLSGELAFEDNAPGLRVTVTAPITA